VTDSRSSTRRGGGAGRAGLIGGGLAIVAGLAVIWVGTGYEVGTARRMGPGWFPVALGGLMAGLGLLLALVTLRRDDPCERGELRPLMAVGGGIAAFALLLERAGLVPAVLALVLVSGLGGGRLGLGAQLLLAGVLAGLSLLIFRLGLGLPLRPLIWP